MRKIVIAAAIVLWSASWAAAQGTARLSEMRTSRGVDPKLQSPVDVTETFGPKDKAVFLTVKLSDAPKGTDVKIVAYYLQNGKPEQIAVQDFRDIYGTGYLSYRISPPPSGWPLGRYKATFYLNGQEHGSIGFAVAAPKPGELGSAVSPGSYKTFSSASLGFSIQYPADWVEGERGAESVACMYLSNPDNNPIASLNVQVVPIINANPSQAKEAINLVAEQLIGQITKDFKGRVRGDQWVTAGGKGGRELDSEYPYQGKTVRQRQFLTYNAAKVFVVIYTVEANIYAKYAGHYLQATKSLSFSRN